MRKVKRNASEHTFCSSPYFIVPKGDHRGAKVVVLERCARHLTAPSAANYEHNHTQSITNVNAHAPAAASSVVCCMNEESSGANPRTILGFGSSVEWDAL